MVKTMHPFLMQIYKQPAALFGEAGCLAVMYQPCCVFFLKVIRAQMMPHSAATLIIRKENV